MSDNHGIKSEIQLLMRVHRANARAEATLASVFTARLVIMNPIGNDRARLCSIPTAARVLGSDFSRLQLNHVFGLDNSIITNACNEIP